MPKKPVGPIVGLALVAFGVFAMARGSVLGGLIPLLIGGGLIYLGYRPGRAGLILFGHVCIVVGSMLVTWGIYLLPHSQPVWQHIFLRPLFWGLISIFGGICANYHGFCRCVKETAA